MKRNKPLARLGAMLALLVATADAQTAPPAANASAPADQKAIELSPFVITENSETGWVATETLAGSRLRTNFKDVANQIETLTKDFMTDLGMNSVNQAAIYTANAENFSDYVHSDPDQAHKNPTAAPRIRGVGNGTNSRNFFRVILPTENFNIERATFASGPNAILFGLGSPAGIIDSTPARAQMRNKYGFTLQYDSEASKRGTFDANKVILKDRLALRLMGMSKREYVSKKPNHERDDRIYGTLTFKPFQRTTLILQGERANGAINRANRMLPNDNVSLWAHADQIPGSGYSMPRPVYDNTNFTNIGSNRVFTRAGDVPVLANDGSPMRNWLNSVTVRNPNSLPDRNTTYDGQTQTVNDPNIFPFDINLGGTLRNAILGGITKTAIIEQQLARDLHLELAFNHEKSYAQNLGFLGFGSSIHVDANRYLPGSTQPNPNVGKLYIQNRPLNTLFRFEERAAWRAALSYEIDFARKFGNGGRWTKWLGRHRLAGLYTVDKSESLLGQEYTRRILDDPVLPGITLRPKTFRNWAAHATRVPQFRYYFNGPRDSPSAPGPMTGDWSLLDANNNPYTLYLYDNPLRSETSGKRLAGGQAASGARNKSDAMLFAWQGYFFPDRNQQSRLVVTYGYRKDSAKVATPDADSTEQDFSGLYPVVWDVGFGPYGEAQSGINRNIGIVARPLSWLSVFVNKSTSFDVNVGRYDPFGNEYPGAGGDGKDYGLRFDLWRNKLSLRINRYEASLGPQRATNQIQDPARDVLFRIDSRVRELDPTAPTINITEGNRRGYREAGRPNYWIMSNFASTGYEVELNFTPVPNWNIRVNGSKSKAVESDIGRPWFEWVEARLPAWQSVVAKNGEVDEAGRPLTWENASLNSANPDGQTLKQHYDVNWVSRSLAFLNAVEGRATDAARPARANLITNYHFTEGVLKGFNLGGAARWRAAPNIGYGTTIGPSGEPDLDISKEYRGKRELYFDAILGYRGRMKAFGGFVYRLQLNVRNVLNEDDPIPVTALTTGEVVRLATIEPRVFMMTFGVDF